MWEDTNDSGNVISTKVLCRLLKKHTNRTDIVKVIIDDLECDKEILSQLY